MKIPFPKTGLLLYLKLSGKERIFDGKRYISVAKLRLGNLAKRGKQ